MDKKKLESRVAKTKAEAQKNLARREKLNIRFSEEEIGRIFEVAERNKTRVMPMLRAWVIASLENEERSYKAGKTAQTSSLSYSPEDGSRIVKEPMYSFLTLLNRLADLELRVQQLEVESPQLESKPKPRKKTD